MQLHECLVNNQGPGNLRTEYRCVCTQRQQQVVIVQQRRITTFLFESKQSAKITCTELYLNLQTAGGTDCRMAASNYNLKFTFYIKYSCLAV